ncbi:choline/carnitine O-acyltransferase [Enterococcus sp. BWT-B8]|uniref:choline/carnitine O-acyltransferase n=1 Tax=Enterococcus sp. BWT-B8 TaxID=2885157 RepID=UPI001E632AA0|nr:choline/carnitine O-acyltransferase [Enterococcus sp. BWT-B8]MCB5951917.1 choline/carnitine O-acyltransferase [Enterococcus sp. BWT-B8]
MKRYKEELRPLLKKLPVPVLEDTLEEAVEWAAPFLTDEEMDGFRQIIRQFAEAEGMVLQARLNEYCDKGTDSWLAPFWEENYLALQGHLQTQSNFALVINPKYHKHLASRAEKAAGVICSLVKNCQDYYEERFPLDYTRKNEHLDMSFYGNFYGNCRIPGEFGDSFYKAAKPSRHVIVVNDGCYYQLEVINDAGQMHSQDSILAMIHFILTKDNYSDEAEKNLAYSTGVKRNEAGHVYRLLKKYPENAENLAMIEHSLFMLSFNAGDDMTENGRISTMLLDGKDQFYTKTIQAIITENGGIGFNMEHTAVDGVPAMNLLTQVFKQLNSIDFSKAAADQKLAEQNIPVRLNWHLTDEISAELVKCKELTEAENNSCSIQRLVLDYVGKEQIKAFKISPDALFHMALAVAQQRVFDELKSVYEPVAMREFYQGRTECARSVSLEKKKFAEAFVNRKKESAQDNLSLYKLFMSGIEAHSKRISRCQEGLGVERHLFGLQKMTDAKVEAEYFFSSDGIQKISQNFISTTGIPSDLLESFSFGPVEQDGFGLYYGILENRIALTISSRKELTEKAMQLLDAIDQAITELLDLAADQKINTAVNF